MTDPRTNIPSLKSKAKDWMDWHKDLLSVMAEKDATEVWVAYYSDRGDNNDDFALRSYMKNYGVDLTSNIFERLSNTGYAIGGSISNAFGIGKNVILVVGAVMLISVLGIVVQVARKPFEAANAASKFAPGNK
jgi:hypothetical protein